MVKRVILHDMTTIKYHLKQYLMDDGQVIKIKSDEKLQSWRGLEVASTEAGDEKGTASN